MSLRTEIEALEKQCERDGWSNFGINLKTIGHREANRVIAKRLRAILDRTEDEGEKWDAIREHARMDKLAAAMVAERDCVPTDPETSDSDEP